MRTLGRAILTIILCVALVGFGLCGAYGTFGGLAASVSGGWAGGLLMIGSGALGFAIAWLCWLGIASLWRTPPAPPANR